MEKIVNLTPHPLVFADGRTIESSGIARCEVQETEIGILDGIPIITTAFGQVVGLPEQTFVCNACANCPSEPQTGGYCACCCGELDHFAVVYVVSSITAQACGGRSDVFVPCRPIRDDKGRIIGCGALGRITG
jgi:hypothetical protein